MPDLFNMPWASFTIAIAVEVVESELVYIIMGVIIFKKHVLFFSTAVSVLFADSVVFV